MSDPLSLPGVNVIRKTLADGSVKLYYRHRASGIMLGSETEAVLAAHAALPADDAPPPQAARVRRQQSIASMIRTYKESSEFRGVSARTAELWLPFMTDLEERVGNDKPTDIDRLAAMTLKETLIKKHGVGSAKNRISFYRRLWAWARDVGLFKGAENPFSKPGRFVVGGPREKTPKKKPLPPIWREPQLVDMLKARRAKAMGDDDMVPAAEILTRAVDRLGVTLNALGDRAGAKGATDVFYWRRIGKCPAWFADNVGLLLKGRPVQQRPVAMEMTPDGVRMALLLGFCTLQRLSDVLAMTNQIVKVDAKDRWWFVDFCQQKTGTDLEIPVHKLVRAEMERQDIIPAGGIRNANSKPVPLVTSRSGESYGRIAFAAQFRLWQQVAGLDGSGLDYRALRRSGMVWLAENNVNIPKIAAISGHAISTATMILNRYIIKTKQMAESGMDVFDGLSLDVGGDQPSARLRSQDRLRLVRT